MGEDGAVWRGNHLAHETSPMRSIYGKNGFSSGRERVVKGVRYERGCLVCRAFMERFFFLHDLGCGHIATCSFTKR